MTELTLPTVGGDTGTWGTELNAHINGNKPWRNVKAFGAAGNGTADDTAEIQAAVDSVASTGGLVYLPVGIYKITSPIKISTDHVHLLGEIRGVPYTYSSAAEGGTVIKAGSGFSGQAIVDCSQTGTPTRSLVDVSIRELSIGGYTNAASSAGIYFECYDSRIEHCFIAGMQDGIRVPSVGYGTNLAPYDSLIHDCKIQSVGRYGISFEGYASDFFVTNVQVVGAGSHGIDFATAATAHQFLGCYIYNCTGKAINSANMHQLKFVACRLQDCNGGIYVAHTAGTGGLVISGCTFRNMSVAADNTTDAINLTSTISVRGGIISGCDFQTDAGNTNGGSGAAHYRARYGVNIASGNVTGLTVAACVADYNASEAAAAFGTNFVLDGGTNTILLGPWARGVNQVEFKLGVGAQRILTGSGTPESAVTAPVGSLFLRTDGGAATSFYVKETGSGNTGWVGK